VEFDKYDDKEQSDLYKLINNVILWHYDRNLIEGSTDKDQVLKLAQELGELSDSVCKGKDIKDDIGDMLVVMLNIAERNGVILAECLQKAWNDIKNRKGRMVDGIFVKESDL
jgi:NTP pyrophosphatase (non-canonical NTP hydrolase)